MNTPKKILLLYKNQTLSKVFEENLRQEGYSIEVFFKENFENNQLNLLQKTINIFYRLILKDNSYPLKANEINFRKFCKKSLRKIQGKKFDFCLAIRGDLLPEFVLKSAQKKCNKLIGFQLDGISVSKRILHFRKYFDELFVFDPDDEKKYKEYKLTFLPNCYFGETNFENQETLDFLYIGQFLEERQAKLFSLHHFLKKNNISYTSHTSLYSIRPFIPDHKNILNHNNSTSYLENIEWVKKSKIIIDFKREEHHGLSLRFFEAMQFGKKIITNNPSVRNYDFYHPDNIYITDFKNFEGLKAFIERPHKKIDPKITEKYSFKNWIKTILNEQKKHSDDS